MQIDDHINQIVEKVLTDRVKDKLFDPDLVKRGPVPENSDALFSLWYGDYCLGLITVKPRVTPAEQYFMDIAFIPNKS